MRKKVYYKDGFVQSIFQPGLMINIAMSDMSDICKDTEVYPNFIGKVLKEQVIFPAVITAKVVLPDAEVFDIEFQTRYHNGQMSGMLTIPEMAVWRFFPRTDIIEADEEGSHHPSMGLPKPWVLQTLHEIWEKARANPETAEAPEYVKYGSINLGDLHYIVEEQEKYCIIEYPFRQVILEDSNTDRFTQNTWSEIKEEFDGLDLAETATPAHYLQVLFSDAEAVQDLGILDEAQRTLVEGVELSVSPSELVEDTWTLRWGDVAINSAGILRTIYLYLSKKGYTIRPEGQNSTMHLVETDKEYPMKYPLSTSGHMLVYALKAYVQYKMMTN